jgi:hypothetical protein
MSIDLLSALVLGPVGPADPVLRPPAAAESSSSPGGARRAESAVPQARAIQVNASFGENHFIIYRIVDKETGDLIQQIPPEQLLEIARGIRQLLEAEARNSTLDVTS